MKWQVTLHREFDEELQRFPGTVRKEILTKARILAIHWPNLGRPQVGTLKNSSCSNMKEFRCDVDAGAWRITFAFDTVRKAVFLVAGDKAGVNQKRFCKRLFAKADKRFERHLST